MGGHAFKDLHCPRIPQGVYNDVKAQAVAALRSVFSYVVVPTEMPEKADYGDVDILVSGPIASPKGSTMDSFDWQGTVCAIKAIFNTTHGRRGFLNPDCMYFAVAASHSGNSYWIQIDVKVCFRPELFDWYAFELNYASNSKMIGSMIKPLGLTIDPEGFHIRVEEIEETNFPGSMVWISADAKDVLRVVGLDRRIINAGFTTKNEIYKYFASSWLFNPAHFAARLAEEKYFDRLEERSPHWTHFIKQWVPEHFPDYKFTKLESAEAGGILVTHHNDLQTWYKQTRAAVREKVFTMFPNVATAYYSKRAAYVKETDEARLRQLVIKAIPSGDDGWKDDFPCPRILVNRLEPTTPTLMTTVGEELTPPLTPVSENGGTFVSQETITVAHSSDSLIPAIPSFPHILPPHKIPLYLEPLPRAPPYTCTPHPPPANMSPEAKLLCIARWTRFDSSNGIPHILSTPQDKDFEMAWTDAVYAGATEEILVKWAKEMWWLIWIRQSHVNYIGMWKKRFEKEDKKAEKARQEDEDRKEVEKAAKASREKIMGRLKAVNYGLGL